MAIAVRAIRCSLYRRTSATVWRRLGCRLNPQGLRRYVGNGRRGSTFRGRSSLNENFPDHRQHRPGTKPTALAISDLLDCFVRLAVNRVQLQPCIFHNASAHINAVSH
jgi:hypothetical protein